MGFGGGRILKSTDGGMNWNLYYVTPFFPLGNGIQGIGFIDSLKGWTGGGFGISYESNDGGLTWDTIDICYGMNRVIKVNDTLLFASGRDIWKYNSMLTAIDPVVKSMPVVVKLNCYPNPADNHLTIEIVLNVKTHARVTLHDEIGKRIKLIENADKPKGVYTYKINTENFAKGIYYIVLKTHEDDQSVKVMVTH
jgi:hypothetical protein